VWEEVRDRPKRRRGVLNEQRKKRVGWPRNLNGKGQGKGCNRSGPNFLFRGEVDPEKKQQNISIQGGGGGGKMSRWTYKILEKHCWKAGETEKKGGHKQRAPWLRANARARLEGKEGRDQAGGVSNRCLKALKKAAGKEQTWETRKHGK